MTAVLRPRGPYSLAASALGGAGGTRRMRDGVLEIAVRAAGAGGLARAAQRADGAIEVAVDAGDRDAVVDEVRRILRLDLDLGPFRARFRDDPLLGPALRRRPGYVPALRGTPAQALVAAAAGQLVTWRQADAVERRVVARAAPGAASLRLPPDRGEIAGRSPAELAACGLGARRAAAVVRVAGALDLSALARCDRAAAVRRLSREPGLGPWSASVVCGLGLGRVDVGPVGDLGLIRLLSRLRGRPARAEETAALLAPYAGWEGLAGSYLLTLPDAGPGGVPETPRGRGRRPAQAATATDTA